MVEQPITSGLLKGKSGSMHLIDRDGNETSPLFSSNDMRRNRMVVDYEENKVMFKDNPETWHTLPVTKKGLMMIPLTNDVFDRHLNKEQDEAQLADNTSTSDVQHDDPSLNIQPPPQPSMPRPKGKRRKKLAYTAEAFDWYTC